MYSMRNLSRPSLTHYELDSKSPCMAAPNRAHAFPGMGSGASEDAWPPAEWCAHLRLLEEQGHSAHLTFPKHTKM